MTRFSVAFSTRLAWTLCAAAFLAVPAASADVRQYEVERFELAYAVEHDSLPPVAELLDLEIALGRGELGYVEPVPGLAIERHALGSLGAGGQSFGPSAVAEIGRGIVASLNRKGLVGVYVAPSSQDLDPETGEDLRAPERRALRLDIWVGRTQRARTVAAGYGINDQQGVNRASDARILRGSPIQPYTGDGERNDLLALEPLEEYVYRLNRYPRRYTRLALTSGTEPASVNLEYQVFLERPWSFYAEASNTGTDSTGKTRHRFGFLHHQLTGNDDTLHVEYLTGRRQKTQAFVGSYEAPVPGLESIRARASGSWSEFTADDLGFATNRFEGTQSEAGVDLIANVFQRGPLFLDVRAGLGFQRIDVDNRLLAPGTDSNARYLLPRAGVTLERVSGAQAIFATLDGRLGITNESEADLVGLGRIAVDDRTFTLNWSTNYSTYLEPWLARVTDRVRARSRTHEIRFITRGQVAFNKRLIPQHQFVAGGASSVRGYPQSAIAGDEGRLATLEYRLHLPLLLPALAPVEIPRVGSFAVGPSAAGDRPDWDLVLRTFYDAARVHVIDRESFESSDSLASAGFGLEITLRRNVRAGFDCGWALRSLRNGEAESGDRECHASATLVF